MSKVKKNVFQEFMQEDYIPEGNQCIVKYIAGKGNNLHEVEDIEGSIFLVSMPKKFRQTVWLKRNDCIVVDPIAEGKKVLGEIFCVIPLKNVINIIQTGEWCPKTSSQMDKDTIIDFFKKHLNSTNSSDDKTSSNANDDMMNPPSASEEEEDDDDEEDEEDDEDSENENSEDPDADSEVDNES